MLDDPLGLIVQGIFVLAAGMYPVGFLFGTCSACCCRNDTCEGFDLEEAMSKCRQGAYELCLRTPDLLTLGFTSSCGGSGASGTAQAPGADVGGGAITSVALTNGGSGYAIYGRAAPTLSIANAATTPATATVQTTLAAADNCGRPHYTVSGVTITDGGAGYTDGQSLQLTRGASDVQETAVQGTIFTGRSEPELVAEPSAAGSGAVFSVTVASNGGSPETWRVASVTVSGEPVGFESQYLSITGADESVFAQTPALVRVEVNRAEPTVDSLFSISSGGSGIDLSIATSTTGSGSSQIWSLASATIVNGGTGYVVGDLIEAWPSDGVIISYGYFNVDAVDENGAVLALSVDANAPGEFYDTDGTIDSVTVESGGSYYSTDGELAGVTITNGGKYYRPDPTLPAIVFPVTVTVVQSRRLIGTGAQITANVQTNTASPNFGAIASLTLVNGGSNYLGWDRDMEYIGDGKFAFGTAYEDPQPSVGRPSDLFAASRTLPSKGCWVSGEGIAFGTRVTDKSHEILEDWVPAPKTGCCRFTIDLKRTGNPLTFAGTVWATDEVRTLDSIDGALSWNGAFFSGGVFAGSPFSGVSGSEQNCEEVFDGLVIPGPWIANIGAFEVVGKSFGSWDECLDCNGNPTLGRGTETGRIYSGRIIVTVDPPPEATPTGCIKFCGRSGLCVNAGGSLEEGLRFGEDATDAGDLRRMCMRWLCRCYEGTGKKNQPPSSVTASAAGGEGATFSVEFTPYENGFSVSGVTVTSGGSGYAESGSLTFAGGEEEEYSSPVATFYANSGVIESVAVEDGGFYPRPFPDPSDWYEVESTTEVGGPVVFGGTITEKLEDAEGTGENGYVKFEHETIFYSYEWEAEEGSRICLVYAFVFYGTSADSQPDRCQYPKEEMVKIVEPRDVYQIIPCTRCSCQ